MYIAVVYIQYFGENRWVIINKKPIDGGEDCENCKPKGKKNVMCMF